MEDSVQIKCTRCKNVFRERAKRLQNGFSRQCTSCEAALFFDEDSQNPDIKRAMRTARRLRKELRELETEAVFPAPSSGSGSSRLRSGRGRSQARSEETASEED
jgi:predicted  nucleic acid-binding Zn-ribbon protein